MEMNPTGPGKTLKGRGAGETLSQAAFSKQLWPRVFSKGRGMSRCERRAGGCYPESWVRPIGVYCGKTTEGEAGRLPRGLRDCGKKEVGPEGQDWGGGQWAAK